jgi:hypothetical protein
LEHVIGKHTADVLLALLNTHFDGSNIASRIDTGFAHAQRRCFAIDPSGEDSHVLSFGEPFLDALQHRRDGFADMLGSAPVIVIGKCSVQIDADPTITHINSPYSLRRLPCLSRRSKKRDANPV